LESLGLIQYLVLVTVPASQIQQLFFRENWQEQGWVRCEDSKGLGFINGALNE
jgi:hypothetical protein